MSGSEPYGAWRACVRKKRLGQRTAFEIAFSRNWCSYRCRYCDGWHVSKGRK